MKEYFTSFVRTLLLLILLFTLHVGAASAEPSESEQPSVRLVGHVPTVAISKAHFLQSLDKANQIPLTFVLPLRNQKVLEERVNRNLNKNDPYYGKYLTPEEFVEQFAPTQEHYDQVVDYAKNMGLTVIHTHPNRTLLNVTGQTASIEKAFNLRIKQYLLPNGRKFYAPNKNPKVPASVASLIKGIVGLDNYAVWHPYRRQKQAEVVNYISKSALQPSPSGPGGGYSPQDLLTAYNLSGLSVKGSGQTIALFELAAYQASDIDQYASFFGLPPPKLQNILVDGGSNSGIDIEVTLDIELALSLAPQSQIYVYEGPNSSQGVLDTYNQIATDNLAKQVSTSWGIGEDTENAQTLNAENAIFLQMAAQGQTIFAAAGDSGAYDDPNDTSPVVDDPASQPYVVSVGGTRLTVNSQTGAYESESVWNNGVGNGAGGGGVSTVWPIPAWQTNVSTTFSKSHRNVPDVALNADPQTGYSVYYNGQWMIFGGTSCAAPLWSAFTALVNQEREVNQYPALGFANPLLYSIGNCSAYTANFNDITTGNNLHYSANTGYDNATGWGSFNGASLFGLLTNSSPLLNIFMKHSAPFIKGEIGTYKIAISNLGNGSTSEPVNVTITLPDGLAYSSSSGSGWTFNEHTLTFTHNSILKSGSSYPTIILKVLANDHSPYTVMPSATVSGGGSSFSSTVSDVTTVR